MYQSIFFPKRLNDKCYFICININNEIHEKYNNSNNKLNEKKKILFFFMNEKLEHVLSF